MIRTNTPAPGLLVLTPLAVETRAVQSGFARLGWVRSEQHAMSAPAGTMSARIVRTGMGPRRSAAAAPISASPAGAVVITGFAGALDDRLVAGDVVVATEIVGNGTVRRCPSNPLVAAALRAAGLTAYEGRIVSTDHLVRGEERAEMGADGCLVVDMESAWLAAAVPADRPLAVIRVVTDTPLRELASARLPAAVLVARRVLARLAPALVDWARAAGPRDVLLASPRSFCAGVDRAIDTVEHALAQRGAPIYVRKQIVHNSHVVQRLERSGAVFVDELDEVPPGSTVVFSAHGVSPAVREAAAAAGLDVIDATCPLVAKVHAEARRFGRGGETVVLVGHRGHEEVEGTTGEAPDAIHVVEDVEEARKLELVDPRRVAYLTQTTLAVDETSHIVEVLRERFPDLVGPGSDDICYATTNRQEAVRVVARDADLVLVLGSANSSNSRRLVEVAEREGVRGHLIEDAAELDPAWLAGARAIGVTAGASAPAGLVEEVVAALAGLGPVQTIERAVADEAIHFTLPKEVAEA